MSKILSNGTFINRDYKLSNGAALLEYQNYANLKKHLAIIKPIVQDEASESYYTTKQSLQEIHESFHKTNKKELDRENKRIFGRLINIIDVSHTV